MGRVALAVPVLAVMLLLLLAAFPWGWLRSQVERRLTERLDAPVTIGGAARADLLSFHPTLLLTDIRIGQPAWAGPGALANVRQARVRLNVWVLLRGGRAVEAAVLDGAEFNLVRDANGRANWEGRRRPRGDGGEGGLDGLMVRAARLRLRDEKRGMTLDARLDAGPAGLSIGGAGNHRGTPMTLRLAGAPVAPGRWPFHVTLRSPLLTMQADAVAARALDLGEFTARITGSATDARRLDDVIEAGLPGTQPVRLSASVRHKGRDWDISRLEGSIGRSHLTGALTVRRPDDRTRIDGRLDFAGLDFDDLATDDQLAAAAARRARIGPRVIPDTQIHFEKLGRLDGKVEITARRLLARRPTLFRSLSATITMDRRLLTIRPLNVGLDHGRMRGAVTIDHRSGEPKLRLDLTATGSRLEDLLGGTMVQAPLTAHIALSGTGRTVRRALAGANGEVGMAARSGSVEKRLAVFGGGDVIRGIGTLIDGGKDRVPLRCVAARFAGKGGRLSADPLLVDTALSGATGRGTINLDGETLDLAFQGRSKRPGLIQSTVPMRIRGTLSSPDITVIPIKAKDKGLLGKVGAFIGGLRLRGEDTVAAAPDRDCGMLTARVLR